MKIKKRTKKLKGGTFMTRIKTLLGQKHNAQTGFPTQVPEKPVKFDNIDWDTVVAKDAVREALKEANKKRIKANEKRIKEITDLRDNHSNENPSIYMQNSHGLQTEECLKVPKNTLIIFTTATGDSSRIGAEIALRDPDFSTKLKIPTPRIEPSETKTNITRKEEEMKQWIKNIVDLNLYPSITFHYSDYFGVKPIGDQLKSRRLPCPGPNGDPMNITESYTDHIYSGNHNLRATGFTTLDQFVNNYSRQTTESLDISPYHTKQLLLRHLNTSDAKEREANIKHNMPYFDIASYEAKDDFFNYYFEAGSVFDRPSKIFDIMTYPIDPKYNLETQLKFSNGGDFDEIKLSELMAINGPGIYIHSACRPFFEEEDGVRRVVGAPQEALDNSRFTQDAICPWNREVGLDTKLYVGKYRGCDRIQSITIGKENKTLDGTFRGCARLKTVIFEEGSKLEGILQECFYNCHSLTEILIPDTVTQIGGRHVGDQIYNRYSGEGRIGVFEGCTLLKKITLPKNLKIIYSQSFAKCEYLTDITFTDKIEYIGKDAFIYCDNLRDITFSTEIKEIEINQHAFPADRYSSNEAPYNVSFGVNTKINGNSPTHPDTKKLFPTLGKQSREISITSLNTAEGGGRSKKKKSGKQKAKKSGKQKSKKFKNRRKK
jgi:hypothetical protein